MCSMRKKSLWRQSNHGQNWRTLSLETSDVTKHDAGCGSYRQVATALGHLPDVGYIEVLKTANGTNRTYTVPANESVATTNFSLANDTEHIFWVWEWEVTFVTKAGDLPLMAAVWSDGRTLPGQDEGFEMAGRAAHLTCGSCRAFASDSWSSAAEAIVGLRMEVRH